MKNARQAAYPNRENGMNRGLTKREAFAMAAMTGLSSTIQGGMVVDHATADPFAMESVFLADALLAALEEE